MRILRLSIAMGAGLALMIAATPLDTAAQAHCGFYQQFGCPGPTDHWVAFATEGDLEDPHSTCLICFNCHDACIPDEDEDVQLAYAAAAEAARVGDLEALLGFAPLIPEYLSYNSERSAVQLWSCTGEYPIASLNVPTHTEQATLLSQR